MDAGVENPPSQPATDPDPVPTTDAGTDSGDAGGGTRSAFCSEPELVMCFEFENAVKDGSVNAFVPSVSGVAFAPGKVGKAVVMSSGSVIALPYGKALEVSAATVEAWVYRDVNMNALGKVFDDDLRFAMEVKADGVLRCVTTNGDENGGVVPKGVWTHVACVFEADGKIHNYINGDEKASGNAKVGISATAPAAIGGNSPSGEPFVGSIDQLRVFRIARTPAQIAQAAQ